MTQAPLIVLAAGGTGGHMFPAQALAEKMLELGWRVKLSTDQRGARYTAGFDNAVEIEIVSSATFAHRGIAAKRAVPFRLVAGVMRSWASMGKDRPNIVVGFGGYPAIPAMAGAVLRRLPRILHEQNGVLGRVNQLFAKHVHHVACGTWPTELPKGVMGVDIGNPVRNAVRSRHAAAYIPPGDYPMQLVVMGGSQGAKILSDVVPTAIGSLPTDMQRHIRVSHQARSEDVGHVRDTYNRFGIAATVQTFFDDIPSRISEAQLVISRSGASSVADIAVIGRPAIFIPLAAAIRDEQTANTRALVDAGAAFKMVESDLTPKTLAAEITQILSAPDGAVKMANAALSCARPDAAKDLADLVCATAKGET